MPERTRPDTRPSLLTALFFPASLCFHELLLRAFDREYTAFFGFSLICVLLFSLACGLLVYLFLDLIPKKNVSRLLGALLILAFTILVCIERGVRLFFGMYFGLTTVASMGGDVAGDFQAETAAALHLGGWGLSAFGASRPSYTFEYNFTNAVPEFGLLTAQRLEFEYAVFGLPEDESDTVDGPFFDPNAGQEQTPGGEQLPGSDENPPHPKEYGYHIRL